MNSTPSPSSNVRVAVIQAAPALFDTQWSLQKRADFTTDAVKLGAEFVVFPEAFIAGYPKGHDFGVRVDLRSPEGRDEFRRFFENAVAVPGNATGFIGAMLEITKTPRVLLVLVVRYCLAARRKIEGERIVSEEQIDGKNLLEKMRTKTEKQNRKTEAIPRRRARKKMRKAKQADGSEKKES